MNDHSLQDQIDTILVRNARVEAEKAWETSWQRKLAIIVLTYGVMSLAFFSLGNTSPWTSAIIPTLGYTLSTFSLGFMKEKFIGSGDK